VEKFGRIDTLENNAGIFIGKPFTEYTQEDYNSILQVNLEGVFHSRQKTIAQMLEGDGATW
jgi:NADP-dependent 3-hydroxy acid dehydrogenase YdfG